MRNAELTPAQLAEQVEVDVKTVNRWLTEDRIPYPTTRFRVGHILGRQETYLWPDLLADECDTCSDAINGVWPTRTTISSDTWHDLFDRARQQIDILIYAGTFLIETLDLLDVLHCKADQGTRVRVLVGDPDSAAVHSRAKELNLTWLSEPCRTMATYLEQAKSPGLCVRSHGTTLYASHFRFDDVMLINTHAYGVWSAQSPVIRLQRDENPVFDFYANTFDRVWITAEARLDRVQSTRSWYR